MSVVRPPSGRTPNVESPKEELKAETTSSEEPLSSQFAILARQQKALRAKAIAQENAAKQRELEFKAKEDALRAKELEYQSKYISKDKLSQDTLQALADAGVSYEQITNLMLSQNNPQDAARMASEKELRDELKAIKEAQENLRKDSERQQTESYNQALNQIKIEATNLVKMDPSFETIKETNSVGDVVDLIERTFKEDGILLTVEEAAKEVEDYLIEEAMKI